MSLVSYVLMVFSEEMLRSQSLLFSILRPTVWGLAHFPKSFRYGISRDDAMSEKGKAEWICRIRKPNPLLHVFGFGWKKRRNSAGPSSQKVEGVR